MYQHKQYKDKDPDAVSGFVETHPFAVISGCDSQYNPVATQVPVFLEKEDDQWIVRGHMIKGSDHHRAFVENPKVILIFPGAHTYVSASWYEDPAKASTWNYMSAQVRGQIRFLEVDGLKRILQKTSLHFENNKVESPTVFENLPENYTDRLLQYIVAFEVEVMDMNHIFKLSQGQDRGSYERIIEELKKGDFNARTIAGEMEKRKKDLFE